MKISSTLAAALVTAASIAAPQMASAAVVVTSSTAYGLPAITGPGVITFDQGSAPYQVTGNAKVVSGNSADLYAAPGTLGGEDTTSFLAAFPAGVGQAVGSLSGFGLAKAVTFYWGSIDSYNALDFFRGSELIGTVLGSDVTLFPTGDQDSGVTNRTVSISATSAFDRLAFRTGQNAFETDSFRFSSAVPEPATWAMMIAGFGMVGFAMRSARRAKGASVLA